MVIVIASVTVAFFLSSFSPTCVFYFSYKFINKLKVKIQKMLNLANKLPSDWMGGRGSQECLFTAL